MTQKKTTNSSMMDSQTNSHMTQNEIISLIAHEIKNPIASIRGYTELLSSGAVGETNETQKKFLHTILANIDRITELLNDVNDSARIDGGYQKIELESVQPVPLIEELVDQIQPQCLERNVSLQLSLPADLPAVRADHVRLRQVFANLFANAIKYSLPDGQVTITATVKDGRVIFSVTDQGIGIQKEQQPKVFQPYFRTEDAQSREIPGTGLGLYITKRLVEMQGGEIWYESEYLKGSTFYFLLNQA
jgi:signal transduction histidine kinase